MAVEGDMVTALTADSAVSAIISTRVYPNVAPQGAALPHLVYRTSGGGVVQASSGPTSTHNPHISVDCRAKTYSAAKSLSAAVGAVLDGWTNVAGTPSVSSCRLVDHPQEDVEYVSDDSEELCHVISHEYSVWYA